MALKKKVTIKKIKTSRVTKKKSHKSLINAEKLTREVSKQSKNVKTVASKAKFGSKLSVKSTVLSAAKDRVAHKSASSNTIPLAEQKLKGTFPKASILVSSEAILAKTKSLKVSAAPSEIPSKNVSSSSLGVETKGQFSKVSAVAAAFAAHRAQTASSTAPVPENGQISQKKLNIKISTQIRSSGQITTPKDIAEKTAAARAMPNSPKKPINQRHGFKTNEFIVYPTHGVGRIVGIEEQEIAGMSLELFVINFEKEKLTLRVPTGKLESVGMRKLADDDKVKKAMDILKGRARIKRTMWSRRAQEYVAKINSGDLVSIAEVVRDLYRSEAQPEQSYSERQLYEDALDRMAREIAAVERLDDRGAVQKITDVLSKSARGRRLAEEGGSEEIQAA